MRVLTRLYTPRVHQKVTMNGIENSRTKPWKMETTEYCSPEADMIIGRVVSIDVTPPAAIGDNGPETFTRNGDKSKVIISRIIFANNAIVPNSAPLYSVMKILDKE